MRSDSDGAPSRQIRTRYRLSTGGHRDGPDEETIHITCQTRDNDTEGASRIRLRFSPNAVGGKLSIQGEHMKQHNGPQIRIEVPKKTSLTVHMFAGEVKVEQISGDKDIAVSAGQITISNHNWNYRSVDASVGIGQVNAPMYNANKGGFFRSNLNQPRMANIVCARM